MYIFETCDYIIPNSLRVVGIIIRNLAALATLGSLVVGSLAE
jgi:hypothetical protein